MKFTLLFYLTMFSFNFLLLSQQVVLVTDFNQGAEDSFDEFNYLGESLGDYLLAPVNSSDMGLELGVYHGGELSILKDINVGTESSNPSNLTHFDNKIYFSAYDPDNGGGLWATDGTTDGTELMFAYGGSQNQKPRGLIVTDSGHLYYTADNVLYRTDGESQDTIFSGFNFSVHQWGQSANYGLFRGNLAFVRFDNNFIELYVVENDQAELKATSDELGRTGSFSGLSEVEEGMIFGLSGTPSSSEVFGTYLYSEQQGHIAKTSVADNRVRRFLPFNEDLCLGWVGGQGYYMINGRSGEEVRVVSSSNTSLLQSETYQNAVLGDKMAFVAEVGSFGPRYLYLSDGTPAGTSQLHEVGAYRSNMLKENNYAFIASGISNGFSPKIYVVDAAEDQSELLYSFSEQSLQFNSVQLVAVHNDKLFFTSNLDPAVGRELYYMELGLFVNTRDPLIENVDFDVFFTNRTFEFRSEDFLPYDLEVYSLSGQLVESSVRTTNTTYDFSHLTGVYIFRFTKGEKVMSKKVFSAGGN